jgi:membrane fusion protein (multidrug efflux system)
MQSLGQVSSLLLLLVFGLLTGCREEEMKPAVLPRVAVAEVGVRDVPVQREWVGSINGAQNSQIKARVSGYLMAQEYLEGDLVTAGAPLFRIDPRPYQAALAQAQANLAQAQAKAELAKVTLERQTELFKTKVISAQEFDVATQTAQADIAMAESAMAALEAAQLNLEFCTIIAPFTGIVGKAEAQLGDLVGPGASSVLTTISQIQPVKVNFFLTEQDYLKAAKELVKMMQVPLEERPRIIEIFLANGDLYPQKGILDFLNRQVDPQTGTIELVSLFPNPDYILRPGQYAKVRVHVRTLKDAIVIPQRAVTELQGTYYQVMVVNADNTVEPRTVIPDEKTGSDWVIASGLQKGDRIVVEGAQKLQSGQKIDPIPFVPTPTPTPVPTPSPEPIPKIEPAIPQPTPSDDSDPNPKVAPDQSAAQPTASPR